MLGDVAAGAMQVCRGDCTWKMYPSPHRWMRRRQPLPCTRAVPPRIIGPDIKSAARVSFGSRCHHRSTCVPGYWLREQCQDGYLWVFRVGRSCRSDEPKITGQVGARCSAVNLKLGLTFRIQDQHPVRPSLPPFLNLCPRGSPTWSSSVLSPVP